MSREHLIVIRHSLFRPRVTDDDVEEALPPEQLSWERMVVDIELDELRELHEYDHNYPWQQAHERQQQLFDARILPLLHEHPGATLAYFGMAPIPLAFALGTLVSERYRIEVYQRHHDRHDFRWLPAEPRSSPPIDLPALEPDFDWKGELIVRVSSSHRVHAHDTQALFDGREIPTRCFDHGIDAIDEDIFDTRAGLEHFCRSFDKRLDRIQNAYRGASRVHVFAAVPCGVAFRLGTYCCNPNTRLPILTYKYKPDCDPRYAPAVAIGSPRGKARLLLLTADPEDAAPTSGRSELAQIRGLAQRHHARLEVDVEDQFVAPALQRILTTDARILHFAGHGLGASGGIHGRSRELELFADAEQRDALVLMGTDGRIRELPHEDLISRIKAGMPKGLRCVVLSACHSAGLAQRLVRETPIDYAIGFVGAIDDHAAHSFCVALYTNLLAGKLIAVAVEFAGQAIDLEGLEGRDQVCFASRTRPDPTPLFPRLP